MEKKKYLRISRMDKLYEDYNELEMDKIEDIVTAGFFAIATCATIWLPVLLKTNPDMSYADKVKALIYGIGIPGVCLPVTIKKTIDAIRTRKEQKEVYDELITGIDDGRGITFEELEERMQERYDEEERRKRILVETKKNKRVW